MVPLLLEEIHLIPVGWGYMSVHYSDRVTVVTDGGCMPQCFSKSIAHLHLRPIRKPWIWILSHFDYDHFSIVTSLVRSGRLQPPDVVLLPDSYRRRECVRALAMLFLLADVMAEELKIPRPKFEALLDVLEKTELKGVSAGSRLWVGRTEYLFLWPDRNYAELCSEVAEALDRKLRKRCGEGCQRRLDRILRRMESIAERVSPIEHALDVEDLIDREERSEDVQEAGEVPEPTTSLKQIFERAASETGDETLLPLYRSVLNAHSLAYTVISFPLPKIIRILHHADLLPHLYLRTLTSFALLYLGDLQGKELDQSLDNLIHSSDVTFWGTAVLVAPHHGTEFVDKLAEVTPLLVYAPRCDDHSPHATRRFNMIRILYHLKRCCVLRSGHSAELLLELY